MSSSTVQVVEVAPSDVTPITPSIESMLGPITLDAFLKDTYQPSRDGNDFQSVQGRGGQGLPPKALVVKLSDDASQEDRATRLSYLKEQMNNFHPVRMLEASSSTTSGAGINVWLTPDKNATKEAPSKISTLKVEDPTKAALLYKSGHSLYFRAADDLESLFVPPLLKSLGHGIPSAMYYRDGLKRGEIEGRRTPPSLPPTGLWHFTSAPPARLRSTPVRT